MTYRTAEDSQRRAARIAGVTLLLLIATGLCGNFLGPNALSGSADVAVRARELLAHERFFRVSLVCEIVMFNCDVVLALALYALLKPVNAPLALLGSFWRVANATVIGAGMAASLVALYVLHGNPALQVFTTSQLQALSAVFFHMHDTASDIGLIFFCFGAAVHSYLLFQSRYIPRVLSGLYLFAAIQLLLSSFALLIIPGVHAFLSFSAFLPDLAAELSTALWLTIRGANIPEHT